MRRPIKVSGQNLAIMLGIGIGLVIGSFLAPHATGWARAAGFGLMAIACLINLIAHRGSGGTDNASPDTAGASPSRSPVG